MGDEAQRYWDDKAAGQSFSHPLNLAWLSGLPYEARILDYGCGYGRTLNELHAAGWRNGVGADFSAAMIARGRREFPSLDLRWTQALPLGEPDAAFDAVILFAVLTTIPGDDEQRALMAELRRLLKPGGLLYLSDYLLQDSARYLERYRLGAERRGTYGVWDREDGGVFRHQTADSLAGLLSGLQRINQRDVETATLSGASAVATQVLARRL